MKTTLFVIALAAPLLAQGHVPDPVRPLRAAAAMRNSCGLEPSRDGAGLCGGGDRYRAHFQAGGMRFEPALGSTCPSLQHLTLRPTAVRRGSEAVLANVGAAAPRQDATTVRYEHRAGVVERYEARPEGLELSWVFDARPGGDGDLIVRYAVDTTLPTPLPHDGGLLFRRDDGGGVAIGGVTGIDASGARASGTVRWHDGAIELALPDAFVDAAVFPLVLDPAIGAVLSVSAGLTYDDDEPDAAFDTGTSRWLVVWRRSFAANNTDVRGQRLDAAGSLVGTTIFFTSSGVATRPRVANVGAWNRFGVTWIQQVTGTVSASQVMIECADATTGALSNDVVLATSASQVYADADIGSECFPAAGIQSGFVVVYRAPGQGQVLARRAWFSAAGLLTGSVAFAVFSDVALGSTYTQPAIARTSPSDGRLLVVARRQTTLVQGTSIVATVVNTYNNVLGPTTTVASSSSANSLLASPDVDGYAGRWVVAWERQGSGGVYDAVLVANVDLAGASLVVGAPTTIGGTVTSLAQSPSVGYAVGRTWIGYQGRTTLPNLITSLRVTAVDSGSCVSCGDSWGQQVFNNETRIVVATQVSGGRLQGEDALAVFGAGPALDVYAQMLRNHGTLGTRTDLGGNCGSSPITTSFNHAPGIGSSSYRCALGSIAPTSIAAVFNFAGSGSTVPCGACVWLPFSLTMVPPIVSGVAAVDFAIPCTPLLVGSQFETQWTVLDPFEAPCPAFPGFTLSRRTLHTIGQ